MTMTGCVRLALFAAGVLVFAAPVMADETGLAAMHDQRRERGRICFVDHYHYGSSAGQPSKRAAIVMAVKSWAGFTDFEYGSLWAHWGRAASKKVKCGQTGIGGPWSCDISARPCR